MELRTSNYEVEHRDPQNGGGGPEDRRVRRTRDPVASLMTDLTDR